MTCRINFASTVCPLSTRNRLMAVSTSATGDRLRSAAISRRAARKRFCRFLGPWANGSGFAKRMINGFYCHIFAEAFDGSGAVATANSSLYRMFHSRVGAASSSPSAQRCRRSIARLLTAAF
jgi:hypothetical protein